MQYKIDECIKNKSEELDLCDLNLVCLPEIPIFVKILRCSNNNLTILPEKLPDSLQRIDCNNNQITKLRPLGVGPIIPKGDVGPTRKTARFITRNLL